MDRKYLSRVELHCHTGFSIEDGTASVRDIVDFAVDNGMMSVAFTDHGNVMAYPEIQHYCDRKEGFKPIYGMEGYVVNDIDLLGKTTILQCLGNYAKQLNRRNLLYITAENFVSDVIGAIRSSDATTMATLREKYRSLDFLIIEDIQFFCGKDSSTQEFYHTLNDLLTAGAQVVISADRPLDELNLPEELKSKISFATQMEMK